MKVNDHDIDTEKKNTQYSQEEEHVTTLHCSPNPRSQISQSPQQQSPAPLLVTQNLNTEKSMIVLSKQYPQ